MIVIKIWMIIVIITYALWTYYAWKYRKYFFRAMSGNSFKDLITLTWISIHLGVLLIAILGLFSYLDSNNAITNFLNHQIYP